MAFSFALSCLRSYVLLRCNCMYVYLATNTTGLIEHILEKNKKISCRALNTAADFLLVQIKKEGGAFSRCAFDRQNDAMAIGYLLGDGQTQTGALLVAFFV